MVYDKLKGKMRERRITQEELAKIIGVAPSTLNFKLNGSCEFKASEMRKIAEVLDFAGKIDEYFF